MSQTSRERVNEILARCLKVVPGDLPDDVSYGDLPDWDSMGHIDLMLAIEEAFAVQIDEDQMLALTSIGAIRSFVEGKEPG